MAGVAETELCFYARIGDPTGLSQAAEVEHHEQWEYRLPETKDGQRRGRVRVRKTTNASGVRYEETLKTPPSSGTLGETEYTTVIDAEYYTAWLSTFGESGFKKTRYTFLTKEVAVTLMGRTITVPEARYEVDVFYNTEGQRSAWCKIDVEIDGILAAFNAAFKTEVPLDKTEITVKLSALPLDLQHSFSAVSTDPEHRAAIQRFWKSFAHQRVKE